MVAYAYGVWALMTARSSYVKRRRLLERISTDGTVAVSVGVGRGIGNDVSAFLTERYDGVNLVCNIVQEGNVPVNEIPALIRRIRNELQSTVDAGSVKRALFFYGGPYSVAMALGAIFDNWVPVEVFQYDQDRRTYVHAFTLDRETVKGIGPV